MPLESGELDFTRPWGKARRPNLSGARDGSTTEGEDRKRFHALTCEGFSLVRFDP